MNSIYCLLLASAEPVADAAHAAHDAAAHHGPTLWELFVHSNVANFAIAICLIIWLIKKYNLLGGLDTAQQKIINDLRNAETSKQEAIKTLKEAEEKLSTAKEEADEIIKNAEEYALKIKEGIISDANKDAERILVQAKKAIETEKEQARVELQKNLTVAAIEVATDNIQSSLDEQWHQKIIGDFVENLSNVKVK